MPSTIACSVADPAPSPPGGPGTRGGFAQGMAATFCLGTALSLFNEWSVAALILQVALLTAVAALSLGRFCLGSFVYYLVTGKGQFAIRTLPWARGS